jgi:RNA exonuclease 4
MGRSMGLGYEHPVRPCIQSSQHSMDQCIDLTTEQLENARAALDLYRSAQQPWENAIDSGSWPCTLPPVGYAEYFL